MSHRNQPCPSSKAANGRKLETDGGWKLKFRTQSLPHVFFLMFGLKRSTTLCGINEWLFDFKQFDWFGGHWLSVHILVIDYIWKTPETEVIFESAASSDTIYF